MNLISFLTLCDDIAADAQISGIIRTVYNGIRIGIPIILVIVGMIGLGKAIAQQKEDEIKKAQSLLIKQAIAAVIVFLMFSLVQLVVGAVGGTKNEDGTTESSTWTCVRGILEYSGKASEDDVSCP